MKILAIFISLACMGLPCLAGTFNVSPVRLTLGPDAKSLPLTITNDNDDAVVIQVRAMRWSQEKGEDVYEPTSEILVTPPIFNLSARKSQIIRVGLRRALDPERELSYRLYLSEVPRAAKPDATTIHMSLTLAIPVFVTGSNAARPALQWSMTRSAQGVSTLTVRNDGNAHAQVADLKLMPIGEDTVLARRPAATYLLAGTTREWQVRPEPGKKLERDRLRLHALLDNSHVTIELAPRLAD